jgi:carbonic anhydrase/acetyltransferase-like protein (isoleucine patch superfamily)
MILPFNGKTPQISKDAFVAENAVVIGDVTIESDASIWFGVVLRGDIAPIYIGKGTNIQDNAVVHVDEGMPCIIKDNVVVGHSAIIHSAVVESNCLIGMGATVLSGAVVKRDSIIGANALVLKNAVIEEGSLVIGVPCKTVRKLTEGEKSSIKDNAIRYIELSKHYIKR